MIGMEILTDKKKQAQIEAIITAALNSIAQTERKVNELHQQLERIEQHLTKGA